MSGITVWMRVKAGTQKAAAREAAVRLAQGWQPVLWHLSQLATADEPNPVPAIRPSFEMYSPETDEGEADEKFNTDDDVAPDPSFDLSSPTYCIASQRRFQSRELGDETFSGCRPPLKFPVPPTRAQIFPRRHNLLCLCSLSQCPHAHHLCLLPPHTRHPQARPAPRSPPIFDERPRVVCGPDDNAGYHSPHEPVRDGRGFQFRERQLGRWDGDRTRSRKALLMRATYAIAPSLVNQDPVTLPGRITLSAIFGTKSPTLTHTCTLCIPILSRKLPWRVEIDYLVGIISSLSKGPCWAPRSLFVCFTYISMCSPPLLHDLRMTLPNFKFVSSYIYVGVPNV